MTLPGEGFMILRQKENVWLLKNMQHNTELLSQVLAEARGGHVIVVRS